VGGLGGVAGLGEGAYFVKEEIRAKVHRAVIMVRRGLFISGMCFLRSEARLYRFRNGWWFLMSAYQTRHHLNTHIKDPWPIDLLHHAPLHLIPYFPPSHLHFPPQ
jgi:hypothetical protein